MKLFLRRLYYLVVSLSVACVLVAPASTAALDFFGDVCKDSIGQTQKGTSGAAGCKDINQDKLTGPSGIIHDVTLLVSVIGGIAGVVMVMVGGIMYATSGGDSSKLKTARDTIIYSLVGLAVIALARTIILFVLNRV